MSARSVGNDRMDKALYVLIFATLVMSILWLIKDMNR